jgi:hypothetical protein
MAPPGGNESFSITDDKGGIVSHQLLKNGNVCFIAKDVPAQGKKTYSITAFKSEPNIRRGFITTMSVVIDSVSGAVNSLKSNEREWVDKSTFKGLNNALYVSGLDPALYATTTVKKIELVESGAVVRKYNIYCSIKGASEVTYSITQYNGLNTLLLTTEMDKLAVREKESVHIAFPFNIQNVTTRIGIGDTCYTPEHGQLGPANKDFYSVQRWLDVSDAKGGMSISSPQCALFEVGSMIDERRVNRGEKLWKKQNSSSPLIFGYAMNNYWHTNYKADQQGSVSFDFYLQPHDGFSLADTRKFGYEVNQPLLVRVR